MKTSRLRATFFALVAIAVLIINMLLAAPQKAFDQTSKPNIVFVLVDDMDADTIDRAPKQYARHIKKLLIDQGTTFSNYLVNVSLCCPSRTNTLRGQYAHNTKVLTNNSNNEGGFPQAYKQGLETETIATSLQATGYRTALMGKYLNGYPNTAPSDTYIPPGWTEWYSPMEYGGQRKKYGNPYCQYNYVLNQNGNLVKHGNHEKDYATDVYNAFAKDFIERSAKDGKPFFLYLAPFNIHGPYTPAPRYKDLFPPSPENRAPRPRNFNEADVSTKPQFIRQLELLNPEQIDTIDKNYRKRLRSLQSVDDAVEKLVDTLKETGQLDNTYIVLTSDNGYKQGIHRISSGKQSAYEEDIRLNLVVRGPGIPAGKKLPQLVGNIDFFPTFTEMAGVKPPRFVDGRSFLPLLKGTTPNSPNWRSAFLVEHKEDRKRQLALENQVKRLQNQSALQNQKEPECPEHIEFPGQSALQNQKELQDQLEIEDRSELESLRKKAQIPKIPTYQALRTQDYTYVEYDTGEKELYDIKKHPDQLNNLASTADPALLKQLAEQLNKLRTCEADSCRAIEDESESSTP
jgi:N-acetylglucosamine-6-sulfatase